MPVGTATVLFVLLSAGPLIEGSESVTWRLEPGVSCPTSDQLQAASRAQKQEPADPDRRVVALVVLDRPAKAVLGVRVSTLTDPTFDVRREIPIRQSSCQDLAETVVLLVDAWLRDLPELTPVAPSSPPPAPKKAPETAPVPVTASVKQAAPPPRTSARAAPAVGLSLAGGALVGSATAPGVMLGVDIRLSPRVGVTAAGTWIADSSVSDAPFGSVFLQRQLFELEGTLRFLRLGGFSLDGLAGPVLWHAKAQAVGYPVTRATDLFDPGLAAGARLEQHLIGALRLRAQVAGLVLIRSYSLSIDRPNGGPATVGTLGSVALDATLGAAVDLF